MNDEQLVDPGAARLDPVAPDSPRVMRLALTLFLLLIARVGLQAAAAQTPHSEQLVFLEGRATIDRPAGMELRLEGDSLLVGFAITSGINRYYFRVYAIADESSAGEILDRTAAKRQETDASDVTVNLDRVVCGERAVIDLSHWMWHPTTKPQGLLLSKDRMFILEDKLIHLTVEGESTGLVEIAADEFLNSIHYLGRTICTR